MTETARTDDFWGGSEDERWALHGDEGVGVARLRPLVETLIEEFDEDAGGYRQLLTIADPYERAVVSDLISKSAQGMADNLLEARIAQHELAALIGPAGLPMPTRATLRQHLRNGALIDMHLTTFVTALESSCDCLAALAIGVLRIPLPLKTAQFSQFNNLPNLVPLTPDLVRAWGDWQKLLDHHSTTPPAGWREWVTGMRNLHVHRARQGRVMLERRRKPGPPILVPERSAQEALQSVTRFDLHLRRRPHLADMEDLVLAPGLSDFWMNEPVDGTLDAVFGAANDFVEEASHFLLAWWREAETWSSTGFPPPAKAWRPAQALGSSFGGAAPAATPFRVSRGQAHPALVRRFVVAQRLRDARSSASGGSSAPPPEPQGTANP